MAIRFILSTALLFAAVSCLARESVCLKTGFCLEADSHRTEGVRLALRIGTGTIELAADQIRSIEMLEVPVATTAKPIHSEDPRSSIARAADAAGIDRDFMRSVAKIESGFRQDAVSKKGAIGIMQIMPDTAKALNFDASKPEENVVGGARYLRALLLRYHGNSALALAAYNAGPGAVQKFGGVPPYQETRNYVVRVTREYDRSKLNSAKSAASDSSLKRPTPQTRPGRIAGPNCGK
jgi:transglycosylase-like protein with SLT domain